MLAFAEHLLRTVEGLKHVAIHPDGQHGIQFPIQEWLERREFVMHEQKKKGSVSYAGVYRSKAGQSILVNPSAVAGAQKGGDVVADVNGQTYLAECKGGVINSNYAGHLSRLRRGLCEAVGQCLKFPLIEGTRQYSVVPRTPSTENLARQIAPRAKKAGIEIALVDRRGEVSFQDA